MPPTDRFVISFAAEPPQEALPYGRWANTLREYFLAAVREIDTEGEDLGEPGDIAWFPDRTLRRSHLRARGGPDDEGYELFGFVSFSEGGGGPSDFEARADYTSELAESNPDWKLDLNDDVVAAWRGEQGKSADMTLVWGTPMIPGGAIVTAELANLAVDQCELVDERFTLLAPDNYRSDFLEVKLWDKGGDQLAVESLYVDDDDEDEEDEDSEESEGAETDE